MKLVRIFLPMVVAVTAACLPVHEGPQLREPPEGLGYLSTFSAARKVLSSRPVLGQIAYEDPVAGEARPGSVVITTFQGLADRAEVEAAWSTRRERWSYQEYTPIEAVTVSGREAWLWFEIQHYSGRETPTCVLVVPWDEVTYSVEFSARRDDWKDRGFMQSTVRSFDVRHPSDLDYPVVTLMVLAVAGMLFALWRMKSAPPR